MNAEPDPVRARRERAGRLASAGRRLGFALYGLAIVVVIVGLATTFNRAVAATATACLIAGSVLLAPAIVVGYGVRAAEREDRSSRR